MRPFWIDFFVAGKKNNLTGGPKSKDGFIIGKIFVNINKQSKLALQINCSIVNGKKRISIMDEKEIIYEKTFEE